MIKKSERTNEQYYRGEQDNLLTRMKQKQTASIHDL